MADPLTEPAAYLEETKGKARRMVVSHELAAMGDIESILDNLDEGESRRVVAWLFDKYSLIIPLPRAEG